MKRRKELLAATVRWATNRKGMLALQRRINAIVCNNMVSARLPSLVPKLCDQEGDDEQSKS